VNVIFICYSCIQMVPLWHIFKLFISYLYVVIFNAFQREGMNLHLVITEFTSRPSALLASNWASLWNVIYAGAQSSLCFLNLGFMNISSTCAYLAWIHWQFCVCLSAFGNFVSLVFIGYHSSWILEQVPYGAPRKKSHGSTHCSC